MLITIGAALQAKANSEPPPVVVVTATAVPGPVATRTPYASYILQGDVVDVQTEHPIPQTVVSLDGYEMANGSF